MLIAACDRTGDSIGDGLVARPNSSSADALADKQVQLKALDVANRASARAGRARGRFADPDAGVLRKADSGELFVDR